MLEVFLEFLKHLNHSYSNIEVVVNNIPKNLAKFDKGGLNGKISKFLMEKFSGNNYCLPFINLNNILEIYQRLIKIFTVDEYI